MRCGQLRQLMLRSLVMFAILAGGAVLAATRTWTDKTGKFKTQAELVKATAESVELKLSDGKIKTVPLDKLSDADRKFVADYLAKSGDDSKKASKEPTAKPAAKGPDAAAIRKVANKFFDNLIKGDQTALGETLTTAAKAQIATVQGLPKPDTARSVKLGRATIDGEEAILALKMRIGGADQDVKLLLRRESGEWKVRGTSATTADGAEEVKDFESAETASASAEGTVPIEPMPGEGAVPEPRVPAPTVVGSPDAGAPVGRPPVAGEPSPDAGLTPPEGDAAALIAFCDKFAQDPRVRAEPEYRQQALLAILDATDKLFAFEGATKEQLTTAAKYQVEAISSLIGSGISDLNARVESLTKHVSDHKLDDLKRSVEFVSMRVELQTAQSPAMAEAALKRVETFVTSGDIDDISVSIANLAGEVLEQMQYGGMEPAQIAEALNRLAAPLVASKNERAATIGNQLIGKGRRLGLVGNPMELRGLTWDGKPLDMTQFQDKVVLVDFWATWCGPCMEEMPNIRRNYDQYHARGFDVVAISIDEDLKALREYVEREQVPWTVVADNHEEASPADNMSNYYGVNAIPCTILIGRDGKVVTLSARGPQLEEQLLQLVGSGGK